jgi:SH3-like domain-containing protein
MMRHKIIVVFTLFLILMIGSSGAVLAAPLAQEGEAVYGLLGTLRPSESNRYEAELLTATQSYPIVGANPRIEQQIQQISTQEPSAPVKVWGRLVDVLGRPDTQQIVVEALLRMDTMTSISAADELPFAVVSAQRANVRLAPSIDAEQIAQVRQGQEFDLVAQDPTGEWWRICCVDGQYGWIARQAVTVEGAIDTVPTLRPRSRPLPSEETAPPTANWQAAFYDNISLEGEPVFVTRVNAVSYDWGSASPAPGVVPADQFSVRFERTLTLQDGFYEFSVQADDGVRVWIDEELVVDEWHLAAPPVYQFGRELTGPTPVRIEYFEAGGQAGLRFDYQLVTEFPDWRASYFNVIDLAGGPDLVRAEPRTDIALSHYWSLGSPIPGVISADNFSARWTGTYAFEGGDYLFWTRADDGVRLWIDNILVIDAWEDNAGYTEEIFYQIGPGDHIITIEYYERGGIARIEADWYRLNQ